MSDEMLISRLASGAIGSWRQGFVRARSIVCEVYIVSRQLFYVLGVSSPHALLCWSGGHIKVCFCSFLGQFYVLLITSVTILKQQVTLK